MTPTTDNLTKNPEIIEVDEFLDFLSLLTKWGIIGLGAAITIIGAIRYLNTGALW